MKVSIIPSNPSLLANKIFLENLHRDDCFSYLRAFKEISKYRDWKVDTFDIMKIKNADKVIVLGLYYTQAIIDAIAHVGVENILAIFQEPPNIQPLFYDNDIQACFGTVLVPENKSPDNKRVFYHGFPVSGLVREWPSFDDRKILVSISSGKVAYFTGSLYAERIKAIKYFQASLDDQFDMYGQGWIRKTIFPFMSLHNHLFSYRGSCDSKVDTMGKYRYSLCYENSDNIKGYITEKIFDSFQAGCVPIYWGAPDIEQYIPSDCYIDRRQYKSNYELGLYIKSIEENKFDEYQSAIKKYLSSQDYYQRLPEVFAKYLMTMVERKVPREIISVPINGIKILKGIKAVNLVKNGNAIQKVSASISLIRDRDIRGLARLVKSMVDQFRRKIGLDIIRMRFW